MRLRRARGAAGGVDQHTLSCHYVTCLGDCLVWVCDAVERAHVAVVRVSVNLGDEVAEVVLSGVPYHFVLLLADAVVC